MTTLIAFLFVSLALQIGAAMWVFRVARPVSSRLAWRVIGGWFCFIAACGLIAVAGMRSDATRGSLELAAGSLALSGSALLLGGILALTPLLDKLRQQIGRLTAAEQQVRSVVNNVVDGIITIDSRGTIKSVNPAAERIFQYPAADIVGRHVDLLMPGAFRNEYEGSVPRQVSGGDGRIIGIRREVVGRRKDGADIPLDLAISEFEVASRHYFTGIVRDITEPKRAEDTARFLADASAALASLVDPESTLNKLAALAVPAFADWCMVDVVEGTGLRCLAIAHQDPSLVELAHDLQRRFPPSPDEPRGPQHVLRTARSEIAAEVTDAVLRSVVRDEQHLELLRGLGLRSYICVPLMVHGSCAAVVSFATAESGRRYRSDDLLVAEELAHRASVAIDNARLYAALRDADRRKDEFLAMLAHELRNPLAPIRSGLDLLGIEGVDRETSEWARRTMKEQVQHMVQLVDDLLDVSRIMQDKIQLRTEPLELSTVVARAVEQVRPLIIAQEHHLSIDVGPEPLWVLGDAVRLAQVLANLLNNAAKYTNPRGTITLTVGRDGTEAVLQVRDNGIGMDKETQKCVFDLFAQADRAMARSQGGLGIGLTLVRRLVQLHGGRVEALSDGPEQGAVFTVRLPVVASPPTDGEHVPCDQQIGEQEGTAPRRVLVVEDNASVVAMTAALLRTWGHQVFTAHDGPEALRVFDAQRPEIVLLDIGLPGMTGYDIARELRKKSGGEGALLVALTGYGQQQDRNRSREAGFDLHLVKPPAEEDLRRTLVLRPTKF
jgi:PAS domain S-box-containing protein